MASPLKLGFLGAGKMATALAKGFVQAGLVKAEDLLASDPFEQARAHFSSEVGARCTGNNHEVLSFAEVVILAVKPDQVPRVLAEANGPSQPLFISIAAGVTLGSLEHGLPAGSRVVRVMPNTPALVGASASAYTLGKAARSEDAQLVERFFAAVGRVWCVKESLLDAVTGLSGSGPAYVFMMAEALSDGGVAAGLPRDIATQLAAQTLLGAAKMILETGQHPGALKDMVTSPGGTTIEGLHSLEKSGLRGALISAVRAAAERSRQLGLADR